MRFLTIILLCTAAAITYGIIHDQITARICVEYFTVGHPRIIDSDSPTILGLVWAVAATWWVGAGLGLPLAAAARWGRPPRIDPSELFRPILVLLAASAIIATLAGVTGYIAALNHLVFLTRPLASALPPDRHALFLADLWTHIASYAVGAAGGLVLIGYTIGLRRAHCIPRRFEADPASTP